MMFFIFAGSAPTSNAVKDDLRQKIEEIQITTNQLITLAVRKYS